jgi:hypothetical protein
MKKQIANSVRDLRMEVQYVMLEQVIKTCFKEALVEFLKDNKLAVRADTPLLTIGDIAKKLKVTKATIHNWRRRGLIVGRKIGKSRYYTEQELNEALSQYGWKEKLPA